MSMRKYIVSAFVGLFIGSVAGICSATPVSDEYRVPGHCVVITETDSDGNPTKRSLSCEFTAKDYACIKATGKVCEKGSK